MDNNLPQHLNDIPTKPTFPLDNLGHKIILFGQATCPDCMRVKKFFTENAIQYEYHDIAKEKAAQEWVSSFVSFVPVMIMLDGSMMYSPSNQELAEKLNPSFGGQTNLKMPEPEIYDVIVVGGGPAGITAAIYAVRKMLKVLMITKNVGGQSALSADIENYPGFTMITGTDLASKFQEEVERFTGEGLWIKEGVEVTSVTGEEGDITVATAQNHYRSKTVILAVGRNPRLLGVPGEKEFFGHGVATCATCDGPLYKGLDVAVIGGGNAALDAADSLVKVARSVIIINNGAELHGEDMVIKKVTADPKVKIINNAITKQIQGSDKVTSVKIEHSDTHQEEDIPVQGVFIEIGWQPATGFLPAEITKNDKGEVVVDQYGKTSFPGIWAAGDVTNLWGDQIVIAAGEGAKTALIIADYLAKKPLPE